MTEKSTAELLAAEAEAAERHRDDEPGPGYRRARPPKEPAQVYSLRIPVDRLEQLRRRAEARHTTPSALMRQWVLERLDDEATPTDGVAFLETVRTVVREELERTKASGGHGKTQES